MRRTLFNLAAAISFALLIGAAIACLALPPSGSWQRYRGRVVRYTPGGSIWVVGLSRSGWVLVSHDFPYPQGPWVLRPVPAHLRSQATMVSRPLPGVTLQHERIPEQSPDGTIVWHT